MIDLSAAARTGTQTSRLRRAKATINSKALSHNLKKVREFAPNCQIMAVIKANAYGHGLLVAAQQLNDADMFAVAMPEEAYALRAGGCSKPILVLHGFSDATELEQFSKLKISTVVHQRRQLDLLLQQKLSSAVISMDGVYAENCQEQFQRMSRKDGHVDTMAQGAMEGSAIMSRKDGHVDTMAQGAMEGGAVMSRKDGISQGAMEGGAIDAWIKVDTGMHRLGISPDELDDYFGLLRNAKNVSNVFVMSHFANADEVDNSLNNKQLQSFINVTNDIDVDCSMANSAAIIRLPKSHFEIVRPGIMLYGSSPFADVPAADLGLQAVMQFESILIDIKEVKAGESIGYGSTYTAEKELTMGVVAAGYGDGYPRHAKNGTPVWLNNQRCALLGRISMDSLCIDLTDLDASVGDRVVLWGEELSVDEVAQFSDTIAYELLCHAGKVVNSE